VVSDQVRILHEQALFKEPGGAITPLHQDQYYWPVDTEMAVGMWMPLVDVSMEMGPILFASGSHREGYLGHLPISADSQRVLSQHVQARGFATWQSEMRAGDATFHNGWLVHGASANESTTLRSAMVVTYYPSFTCAHNPFKNGSQRGDAQAFCGGVEEGGLADNDETNPVVWRRPQQRL
jgi:ectoine hydroxylase-related dioxygenase (phytanoyl-CoA dioxygenase family)